MKIWLILTSLVFSLLTPGIGHADLKQDSYKNGANIRKVLEKLLAEASRWTTQVLSDGKQIACGTIVDPNGLILTKASELIGTEFVCILHDGTSHKAELLCEDSRYDLAMLGIHASQLQTVMWSEKPSEVGQLVSSFDNSSTPSSIGVISTPARKIPRQTGSLGVSFEEQNGSLIFSRIFNNSAAARYGILKGDKLLGIGQESISKPQDVKQLINKLQPGDLINLQVMREEKPIDLKIRMGDDTSRLSREFMTSLLLGNVSQRRGGFPQVIQHDSQLNVKHCGSPLIGLDGKALGINIARADRVESFALPARDVQLVLAELRNKISWPKVPVPAEPQVKQIDPLVN